MKNKPRSPHLREELTCYMAQLVGGSGIAGIAIAAANGQKQAAVVSATVAVMSTTLSFMLAKRIARRSATPASVLAQRVVPRSGYGYH